MTKGAKKTAKAGKKKNATATKLSFSENDDDNNNGNDNSMMMMMQNNNNNNNKKSSNDSSNKKAKKETIKNESTSATKATAAAASESKKAKEMKKPTVLQLLQDLRSKDHPFGLLHNTALKSSINKLRVSQNRQLIIAIIKEVCRIAEDPEEVATIMNEFTIKRDEKARKAAQRSAGQGNAAQGEDSAVVVASSPASKNGDSAASSPASKNGAKKKPKGVATRPELQSVFFSKALANLTQPGEKFAGQQNAEFFSFATMKNEATFWTVILIEAREDKTVAPELSPHVLLCEKNDKYRIEGDKFSQEDFRELQQAASKLFRPDTGVWNQNIGPYQIRDERPSEKAKKQALSTVINVTDRVENLSMGLANLGHRADDLQGIIIIQNALEGIASSQGLFSPDNDVQIWKELKKRSYNWVGTAKAVFEWMDAHPNIPEEKRMVALRQHMNDILPTPPAPPYPQEQQHEDSAEEDDSSSESGSDGDSDSS